MNIYKKHQIYPSYQNKGWSLIRLWMYIVEENPCISFENGLEKANFIYNELNKINKETFDNNKKYLINNLPFSYFEDDEDFLEFFNIQK